MKVLKSLLLSAGIVVATSAVAVPLVTAYAGTWESTVAYKTYALYGANAISTPLVVYSNATYVDKGVSSSQPTRGVRPDHDGSWRQIASGAI